MRRSLLTVAAGLLLAAGVPAGAQTKNAWLHVRVEEPRNESKVSVNLPLSVVEVALAVAPKKIISEGRIHLSPNGRDLSVSDLRRVWKELRDSGEAEIVSVEDKDETVKVVRAGDRVVITCHKPSQKESVHVEVPIAVVDALLSGTGDQLNVKDALAQLQSLRGDIVNVKDKDTTVRVWIDERS
jgi:hypothetical protein